MKRWQVGENIVHQFVRYYILLFILILVAATLSFFVSGMMLSRETPDIFKEIEGLSQHMDERDLLNFFELASPTPYSYIELLDSNLQVINQINSTNQAGHIYTPEEFYNLLYQTGPDSTFFKKSGDIILIYVTPYESTEEEPVDMLYFTLTIFTVFLFIGILFFAHFTSQRFVIPLEHLYHAAYRLRKGDYNIKIDFKAKNELGLLRDEFNRMAEKLRLEIQRREKAEKDRKDLILNISHDLKSPLTNIRGYAETLLTGGIHDPEQQNYVQTILSNAQRAELLIMDLFELSRLNSEAYALQLKRTDLSEILRGIAAELIPELEARGWSYNFDIPEYDVYIPLDQAYFSRCIHNIVRNSLQHNHDICQLNIIMDYRKTEKRVIITVSDDGKGIPEALRDSLFNAFITQDSARSEISGSGLGLAISRSIITQHHGSIELDTTVDRGCVFHIELPLL